jgi:hypothetical protein
VFLDGESSGMFAAQRHRTDVTAPLSSELVISIAYRNLACRHLLPRIKIPSLGDFVLECVKTAGHHRKMATMEPKNYS